MPNQVVWERCNVFDDDGNATILRRGQMVPDGVDPGQVETLRVIGAVKMVELAEPDTGPESDAGQEEAPAMLEKPSPDATKSDWVAYATDSRNPDRVSEAQANSMSKSALVDRYK